MPIKPLWQYVGEDEAGLLPSKKMYLAGIDYSSQFNNMPLQIYTEWADTPTNRDVQGISYKHLYYIRWLLPTWLPFRPCHGRGMVKCYSLGGDIRFRCYEPLKGASNGGES